MLHLILLKAARRPRCLRGFPCGRTCIDRHETCHHNGQSYTYTDWLLSADGRFPKELQAFAKVQQLDRKLQQVFGDLDGQVQQLIRRWQSDPSFKLPVYYPLPSGYSYEFVSTYWSSRLTEEDFFDSLKQYVIYSNYADACQQLASDEHFASFLAQLSPEDLAYDFSTGKIPQEAPLAAPYVYFQRFRSRVSSLSDGKQVMAALRSPETQRAFLYAATFRDFLAQQLQGRSQSLNAFARRGEAYFRRHFRGTTPTALQAFLQKLRQDGLPKPVAEELAKAVVIDPQFENQAAVQAGLVDLMQMTRGLAVNLKMVHQFRGRAFQRGSMVYLPSCPPMTRSAASRLPSPYEYWLQELYHEAGHVAESNGPANLYPAARDFLLLRATGSPRPLPGYDSNERFYPDDWVHPYVGKDYWSADTEVISMGLEHLVHPLLFRQLVTKDPQHAALIVGILNSV